MRIPTKPADSRSILAGESLIFTNWQCIYDTYNGGLIKMYEYRQYLHIIFTVSPHADYFRISLNPLVKLTAGATIIERKLKSRKARLKTDLHTPLDPDSARSRIVFYDFFSCSIISGAGMISFWGPGQKWHRNQNYRTVSAKLIIEQEK